MIVAGFGFRAGAEMASLADAFEEARGGHTVSALSTVAEKAEARALLDLAQHLRLPIISVDPNTLTCTKTPTQSAASQAARGSGSVAEASALSAAGPGATLLRARVISADRMATCALAQSDREGDPQ